MTFSVKLLTGEIIPTGYASSDFEPMDQPTREIPITYDQYNKLAKTRHCGECGKDLEVWEINVNIVNYYDVKFNSHAKRGRPKFVCYGCAIKNI